MSETLDRRRQIDCLNDMEKPLVLNSRYAGKSARDTMENVIHIFQKARIVTDRSCSPVICGSSRTSRDSRATTSKGQSDQLTQ